MSKRIIHNPYLKYSKDLRSNQTPWEDKLWYFFRAGRFYGLKFKRQVVIGKYIVDFSCREKMVVVELDGGQHSETTEYDRNKDIFLISEGYTVVRIWNNEITDNMSGVLEKIKLVCKI